MVVEMFKVLIVRLKECDRSELQEGDMAAAGFFEMSVFYTTGLLQSQKSAVGKSSAISPKNLWAALAQSV
jgi:hypothetical protein